jgi:hypothetical protein
MRFHNELSCFVVAQRDLLMRFHAFGCYFVLIYVSPKSPPLNASMSIRIFEND